MQYRVLCPTKFEGKLVPINTIIDLPESEATPLVAQGVLVSLGPKPFQVSGTVRLDK